MRPLRGLPCALVVAHLAASTACSQPEFPGLRIAEVNPDRTCPATADRPIDLTGKTVRLSFRVLGADGKPTPRGVCDKLFTVGTPIALAIPDGARVDLHAEVFVPGGGGD